MVAEVSPLKLRKFMGTTEGFGSLEYIDIVFDLQKYGTKQEEDVKWTFPGRYAEMNTIITLLTNNKT